MSAHPHCRMCKRRLRFEEEERYRLNKVTPDDYGSSGTVVWWLCAKCFGYIAAALRKMEKP